MSEPVRPSFCPSHSQDIEIFLAPYDRGMFLVSSSQLSVNFLYDDFEHVLYNTIHDSPIVHNKAQ